MVRLLFFVMLLTSIVACGAISSSAQIALPKTKGADAPARLQAIARAQVWSPVNVSSMDIRTGPQVKGAFPFQETVTCDYVPKQLSGGSPKFACVTAGGDELKVKFSAPATGVIAGQSNAEVFGEVAATRLLWALGFGSDRMYPVRVVCRKCPSSLGGIARENGERLFDPATIERKMPGHEFEPDSSWSWTELDDDRSAEGRRAARAPRCPEAAGRFPPAHRHQAAAAAPAVPRGAGARRRADHGLRASVHDDQRPWPHIRQGQPDELERQGDELRGLGGNAGVESQAAPAALAICPKSFTGTLKDPVISEAGRAFLAGLLTQLSDDQIRALFEVSRVTLRLRDPAKAKSGFATIQEWTDVFKRKRTEIVERKCA